MKVVLDSTVLYRDPWLEGNHLKAIRSAAQQGGFAVVVPEVVVREAAAKFRERLATARAQLDKATRELKALRRPIQSASTIEDDQAVVSYEAHLRGLASQGIEIAPIPPVPHEVLVDRDLADRKPFRSGRGYRDALIWETVVACLEEGNAFLITGNSTDFCEGDPSTLAADLHSDLESKGIDPTTLVIYGNADSFLRAELPRDEAMQRRIKEKLAEGRLVNIITEAAEELAQGHELQDIHSLGLPTDSDAVSIDGIEVEDVDVDDVFDLQDGTFAVDFTVNANASLDVYVPKWNAWDDASVTVIDPDWNEHFVLAATTRKLYITLSAAYDPDGRDSELGGFEIGEIQGVLW